MRQIDVAEQRKLGQIDPVDQRGTCSHLIQMSFSVMSRDLFNGSKLVCKKVALSLQACKLQDRGTFSTPESQVVYGDSLLTEKNSRRMSQRTEFYAYSSRAYTCEDYTCFGL